MTALRSNIRDNRNRGSVADFLQDKIDTNSRLSVVSAYFTIFAYQALADKLDTIENLRFLFGEPRFLDGLDPSRDESKQFRIEDDRIELANKLQQKEVAARCAAWFREKVEIRSVRDGTLLHGKLYHIDDRRREHAIVGSSNFTVRGLGKSPSSSNIELNTVVDGDRDRTDLKNWFDEIWNDDKLVADVKQQVLAYLDQLYVDQAPELIYFKTLFHIFEHYLSGQQDDARLFEQTAITDTDIWNTLFDFQKDGVKGAIHKINAHNGCILADSVGLGKTFSALAVIKYFELRNHRVLVLCPKKLRENWTQYLANNNSELNPFLRDRFSYTVLAHTDLSRESGKSGDVDLGTINWGNYDLVVIDESHNFRNNTKGKRDDDGNIIRKSRYERLMDDVIRAGVKTKILLLSATPVNNDLKDLANQIYFATEGVDSALAESLGIASIKDALATAQRTFTEWAKRPGEKDARELMDRLPAAFFTLLDELTIARSRKHIQRYYKASLAQVGQFPKRKKPIPVYPEIDLKGRFPSYDKLNVEITQYQLSLFNPTKYIKDNFKSIYEDKAVRNFSQEKREFYLIGMMRVNLLKRLESSVHSFTITLERTIGKIDQLIQRLTEFKSRSADRQATQLDLYDTMQLYDEETDETYQVGGKLQIEMGHLKVDDWLKDLANDKQQLAGLSAIAQSVDAARDAKMADLRKIIENKVRKPSTNTHGEPNRKIIVFCAFADTAAYLYENLESWARSELNVHIALVSGGTRPNRTTLGQPEYNKILTNFAPRAKNRAKMKGMPQDAEIDILIATDCISEGQNLQDCDLLVNYDIHWNPVRIIQRFGRIDRIGSLNKEIQLINFWPTPDLNKYINLKNRVEARMALVDVVGTAEDNILAAKDLEEMIHEDMRYRDKQLLRLKDEVLDLEDFGETLSLNEFSLDDFRVELASYIESNRDRLAAAPLGLYGVVPAPVDTQAIRPGTIFCLRQRKASETIEAVNPLQPYFLIYIHDDGEVRLNFSSAKQILEIFRALCQGQKQAYADLCKIFDDRTQGGSDMSHFSSLLSRAVAAIVAHFGRRSLGNLFGGRGGKLVDTDLQATSADDFELVTWLVIQ